MTELVTLLLMSFASWRISYMLVEEDGPYEIFFRLRTYAGIEFDAESGHRVVRRAELNRHRIMFGNLLQCVYCCSMWVSAVFAILWSPSYSTVPLFWLASSAGAILLNRIVTHD